MKIFLFAFFINISITRKVQRIIRTHYDLPMTFRGENYKKLVDDKYAEFEEDLQKLQQKIEKCIERRIIIPKQAKKRCLGDDFEIYEDRFNLFTFKIENVYENMIEVAFNENCLDVEENVEACYRLLDDIKILRFNNYMIIPTIRHNKDKYLTSNFTTDHLEYILNATKYAIEKYNEYKETLDDKKIVMKGLLWNYFLEEKAKLIGHELFDENDEDLNLLDEVGGEDKFFAKKLMGTIEKKFEKLKSQFVNTEDQDEDEMMEQDTKSQDSKQSQENETPHTERKELEVDVKKQQNAKISKQI